MKDFRTEYVKRSQKDYSMSFKLSIVSEVERGKASVTGAQRKYGSKEKPPLLIGSENMVPLIGKIKHQVICPRVKTSRFWNWNRK